MKAGYRGVVFVAALAAAGLGAMGYAGATALPLQTDWQFLPSDADWPLNTSGALEPKSSATMAFYHGGTSATWQNYIVTCTFKTLPNYAATPTAEFGLLFRTQGSGSFYEAKVTGTSLTLVNQAGNELGLATLGTSLAPNMTYVVTVSLAGTKAEVDLSEQGGASLGVFTVTTLANAPGSVGLKCAQAAVSILEIDVTDLTGGIASWTSCSVTPNPVGKMPAGTLKIVVGVGMNLGAGLQLRVRPAGVASAVNQRKLIPLMFSRTLTSTPGVFLSEYTNAQEITSALDPNGAPRAGRPAGDVLGNLIDTLVDGMATVVITFPSEMAIAPPPSAGVQFVIDTIPPMLMGAYAVLYNDAPYGANGVNFGDPDRPYPPMTGKPQNDPALNSPPHGTQSQDWGVAEKKIFFNVGSAANGYTSADHGYLRFGVTATFQDANVYNAYNIMNASGLSRPATGFRAGSWTGTVKEVLEDGVVGGTSLPGIWLVGSGAVNQVTSVPGPPDQKISVTAGGNSDSFTVTWNFGDPNVSLTGIPVNSLPGYLHLSGVFEGRDKAGNRTTEMGYSSSWAAWQPGPVLHVWWLAGADLGTTVTAVAGRELLPTLQWSITGHRDLNIDYSVPANPKPLFTYRVWICRAAGEGSKDQPYDAQGDWSRWADILNPANNQLDLSNGAIPLTAMYDHWVLVTSGAADEAGNVGRWPVGELGFLTPDSVVVIPGEDSGNNWRRFYVPGGKSALVDTTLTAQLGWYGNPSNDFGAATMIPYPSVATTQVIGNFDVGMSVSDPSAFNPEVPASYLFHFALVELVEEGTVIFSVACGLGQGHVVVKLPANFDPGNPPSGPVEAVHPGLLTSLGLVQKVPEIRVLGHADRVANYVFRATTWVVTRDSSGYPHGYPDPTPASFSFKVVPKTVGVYLESSGGEQPVKVFERVDR